MDTGTPHVLVVGVGAFPSLAPALRAAGVRVTATPPATSVRDVARVDVPDMLLVAYRVADRHPAWNVLTVLRADRALRSIPVVVATDDADQVAIFTERFDGLGITVLLDPDGDGLAAEVRRRLRIG